MAISPQTPFIVVSTRPNLIKAAAVCRAFDREGLEYMLVHTGQHYDQVMSEGLMEQLGMRSPDIQLHIRGGQTLTDQLFRERLGPKLLTHKPAYVMVFGDVDGAFYTAQLCKSMNIPIAHVEAGLRCGDLRMKEEKNRIGIDQWATWLFTTEDSALENLTKERISSEKIFHVGNTMIDTLMHHLPKEVLSKEDYVLWTMHRAENIDQEEQLPRWLDMMGYTARHLLVKWFMHHRTQQKLASWSDWPEWKKRLEKAGVEIYPPLKYLEFIQQLAHCKLVVTDSGGIQEEAFFLQKPCITLRDSTERPSTLDGQWNVVIPELNNDLFRKNLQRILRLKNNDVQLPPFWDGRAAERIAEVMRTVHLQKNLMSVPTEKIYSS